MPLPKHYKNNSLRPFLLRPDQHPHFSDEDTLLVKCARTWATPEEIKEALNPDLDWDYIIETATRHYISPLLYYSLEEISDGGAPPEAMKTLQEMYTQALGRNILASLQLSEVLKSASDAQIRVIVLKGMALAGTVYPDVALRPFGDMDLLIPEEDLRKMEGTLTKLGYKQSEISRGFYEKRGSVSIDLQWQLANIDVGLFWKDAVPVSIEGANALFLSPERLLIHLCLHISSHQYSRLSWLVDISETIHKYSEELDWELFLKESIQHRIHPLVRHVLHLVEEVLVPPIPDYVLERLDSCKLSFFEERLFDALTNHSMTGIMWTVVVGFLTQGGITSKIRYIFRMVFPGRDFMLVRYPNRSVYVSYCIHICDAFQELVRALLQARTKRGRKKRA